MTLKVPIMNAEDVKGDFLAKHVPYLCEPVPSSCLIMQRFDIIKILFTPELIDLFPQQISLFEHKVKSEKMAGWVSHLLFCHHTSF